MNEYYVISINGQKAVDSAKKLTRGYCYTGLYNHSVKLGQVEITIDDDGFYKGIPNKWVDVSYISHKNINLALLELSRKGFKGCPAMISKCKLHGCVEEVEELCCFII